MTHGRRSRPTVRCLVEDGAGSKALANLLLMSSPTFGEFREWKQRANQSGATGGALLSSHAFRMIEDPGSGRAVREKANPRGMAESC
jgi:hypothetical protein